MNPNNRYFVGGPAPAPSADVAAAFAARYAAANAGPPSQADQLAALRRSIWSTPANAPLQTQTATPPQAKTPPTIITDTAPASTPMSSTTKMLIGIAVAAGILYFVSRK